MSSGSAVVGIEALGVVSRNVDDKNADFNINNGIDASTCKNDGQTVWTYNQGVVLGALVELDIAAPGPSYLEMAERIALAAIQELTDQERMLHDPGEPNLGADGPQFKGIFVRNLQVLQAARPKISSSGTRRVLGGIMGNMINGCLLVESIQRGDGCNAELDL